MYNCNGSNQIGNNEYLLKICAIGSGNTGKTHFIRKFAEGKFDTNYLPTLGVDITTKKVCFNGIQVKLILVDTAGQEFFGKLRPSYYRGASACLIFCNIDDRKSIESIPDWLAEFKKYISCNVVPIGIVVIKEWKISLQKRKKPSKTENKKGVSEIVDYQIILPIWQRFKKKLKIFFGGDIRRPSPKVKLPLKITKRKAILAELSYLTNDQLVKYFAERYQTNLFEIKVHDCKAIEECFVSMAKQVITRK